jgi:hypothetical protein
VSRELCIVPLVLSLENFVYPRLFWRGAERRCLKHVPVLVGGVEEAYHRTSTFDWLNCSHTHMTSFTQCLYVYSIAARQICSRHSHKLGLLTNFTFQRRLGRESKNFACKLRHSHEHCVAGPAWLTVTLTLWGGWCRSLANRVGLRQGVAGFVSAMACRM